MASSSHSHSKKRKRSDADQSSETTLHLAPQKPGRLGPTLVSFPSVQPPKKTPFNTYLRKAPKSSAANNESQEVWRDPKNVLIVGESETVEFTSSPETEVASEGCSYLVGLHNPHTRETTFIPAPLHILTRQVKSLKNLQPIAPSFISDERSKLRNALGETFGTKKAKAAIRAQERNRVDIDAMTGVTSHIQGRILENTGGLPTKEEAKSLADASRLIPPYDSTAGSPEQVYLLNDIVPSTELDAISVAPWLSAKTDKDRQALLPFSRSTWVNMHLKLVFVAPKVNQTELKILIYISAMLAFKQISRNVKDKTTIQERMKGVSSTVVDGLVARFTESARNSNEVQMTTATQCKLLSYMFALCLRIDDYATDTSLVAKDLQMPIVQVNTLFKSLGCKIGVLNDKELKRLGLPDREASTKRAVLKIPLEFPAPRMKRTKRA